MRSTYLNRTVIAVVIAVVAVAIVFGILRNKIITEQVGLGAKVAQGAELFNDQGYGSEEKVFPWTRLPFLPGSKNCGCRNGQNLLTASLKARFSSAERHVRRLDKI